MENEKKTAVLRSRWSSQARLHNNDEAKVIYLLFINCTTVWFRPRYDALLVPVAAKERNDELPD